MVQDIVLTCRKKGEKKWLGWEVSDMNGWSLGTRLKLESNSIPLLTECNHVLQQENVKPKDTEY